MIPERLHPVTAWIGAANGLGTNADWVSCKTALRVYVMVTHSGTNDTDLVLSLKEATTVAGGSAAAITATFQIWKSTGSTSADTWTRATDAASDTIDPATEGTQVTIFAWDCSKFTSGFDCLQVVATGGHASNFVSATYFIEPRYQPAVSAIVD
jgi:hypothetical protein